MERTAIFGHGALDDVPRVVAAAAFDEDYFLPGRYGGESFDDRGDVAGLVARGDDDGHAFRFPPRRAGRFERPRDEDVIQSQVMQQRQIPDPAVDRIGEQRDAHRQQCQTDGTNRFKAGQGQQVFHFVRRNPVDFRRGALHAQPLGEFQHRLPEAVVMGDDQSCTRVANFAQGGEERDQVVNLTKSLRDNDVVKRISKGGHVFGGELVEAVMRVPLPGFAHHGRADVHADADGRL